MFSPSSSSPSSSSLSLLWKGHQRFIISLIICLNINLLLGLLNINVDHDENGVIRPGIAYGFANNLIVTTVGCMTELDTSEVIMNNMVKAVDESDFPKMHLVVVDSKTDNHIESPYHFAPKEKEITIAFVNPYSKDEFNDELQYVMEILSEEGSEEDKPANAEFIDGGTIGCTNNKRVASRIQDYDGKATIQINHLDKRIEILAGWATGQNSVRLTPKLVLEPAPVQETPKEAVDSDPKGGDDAEEGKTKNDGENENVVVVSKSTKKKKKREILEVDGEQDQREKVSPKKKKQEENTDNSLNSEGGQKKAHRKNRENKDFNEEEEERTADNDEYGTIKVRNKKEFMEVAKKMKEKREAAIGAKHDTRSDQDTRSKENDASNDDRQQHSSSDDPALEPINHRNSIHNQQQAKDNHHKQRRRSSSRKQQQHEEMMDKMKSAEEIHRKKLEQQMNANFPDPATMTPIPDLRSYLFACSFYFFAIGGIIMMFSRKNTNKGRRDL